MNVTYSDLRKVLQEEFPWYVGRGGNLILISQLTIDLSKYCDYNTLMLIGSDKDFTSMVELVYKYEDEIRFMHL